MGKRVQTLRRDSTGRVPIWRALVVLDEAGLLRSNIHGLLFALWFSTEEQTYRDRVAESLCNLPFEQRQAAHLELLRQLLDPALRGSWSLTAHFAAQRGEYWLRRLNAAGVGLKEGWINALFPAKPGPVHSNLLGDGG